MTDKEYGLLMEKGFDNSQINQIEKLTKFFDVSSLLEYIDSNVETDILRDLNKGLKKRHYVLEPDEVNNLLMLLENRINPYFYLDPDLSLLKRSCIMDIYYLKISRESSKVPLSTPLIDYNKCAEVISYPFVDNELAMTCLTYVQKGQDISKFVKEGFNAEQLDFAKKLFENGLEKYIDKIFDINVDSVPFGLVKKIDELGLDFVKYVNLYSKEDLRVVLLNKANDIDLNVYLEDRPEPKKAVLCEVLVKRNLDDKVIKKMLDEIPYDIPYADKAMYDEIIDVKLMGFDIEKIFDKIPKKGLTKLAMLLKDEGYLEEQIKNGLNYINANMVSDFLTTPYDYHKLFELYNEGINIDNLLKSGTSAKRINTLLEIAKKTGVSKNEIFANNYVTYEIDTMKFCIEHGKKDLVRALINTKYPDENAYRNIVKMISIHQFPGFDYSKLLFDKGNDVFKDYNESFEFSEGQKFMLSLMLVEGYIDTFDLEKLRDKKFDEEKLSMIGRKICQGKKLDDILNEKRDINIQR